MEKAVNLEHDYLTFKNEQAKLTATFLNNTGVAMLGAGVFTVFFRKLSGSWETDLQNVPTPVDLTIPAANDIQAGYFSPFGWTDLALMLTCIFCATVLHYIAKSMLFAIKRVAKKSEE